MIKVAIRKKIFFRGSFQTEYLNILIRTKERYYSFLCIYCFNAKPRERINLQIFLAETWETDEPNFSKFDQCLGEWKDCEQDDKKKK